MFDLVDGQWTDLAYVKASNPDSQDEFGYAVSLSADGSELVCGTRAESSAATGINGDETDNSDANAGAAYLFTRTGAAQTWAQQEYVKASNTDVQAFFSDSIALSDDGLTLAIGSYGETRKWHGRKRQPDNPDQRLRRRHLRIHCVTDVARSPKDQRNQRLPEIAGCNADLRELHVSMGLVY